MNESANDPKDLAKACRKCRITPHELEHALELEGIILAGVCEQCSTLAKSLMRIKERERRRGEPIKHGGNFCRSKDNHSDLELSEQLLYE